MTSEEASTEMSELLSASNFSLTSSSASRGATSTEEDNWTAAETVSRTARMDSDGRVCFRVKGGKGAKPAKIPASELSEIHTLLDSVMDRVDSAAESMRSQLSAANLGGDEV